MSTRAKLERVRKTFRHGDRELLVLADLTLDVQTNEVVALLGPSGCGKTTALRILAGLDEPDQGTVVFNPSRHELRLGVVFQQYALYPWLTVERNISVAVELVHRVPRSAAREVARNWLNRVWLDQFADNYPAQLSGGMQQRVALARGLALDPHLLLMDEPFAALDALTRSDLHELTQGLIMESAPTTVFVTHDPLEATFLADRIVVLSGEGTVAAEITVPAARPRTFEDLLSPPLADTVRAVQQALTVGRRPIDAVVAPQRRPG